MGRQIAATCTGPVRTAAIFKLFISEYAGAETILYHSIKALMLFSIIMCLLNNKAHASKCINSSDTHRWMVLQRLAKLLPLHCQFHSLSFGPQPSLYSAQGVYV